MLLLLLPFQNLNPEKWLLWTCVFSTRQRRKCSSPHTCPSMGRKVAQTCQAKNTQNVSHNSKNNNDKTDCFHAKLQPQSNACEGPVKGDRDRIKEMGSCPHMLTQDSVVLTLIWEVIFLCFVVLWSLGKLHATICTHQGALRTYFFR